MPLSSSSTALEVCNEFASEIPGKTFLITGGNGGLGFETARVLAAKGAKCVLVAARSEKKAKDACEQINAKVGNTVCEPFVLNLSSLKQVKQSAEAFVNSGRTLNVLINNAGVMAGPRELTEDGIENQLGVNHVAHFLLTTILLPVLERSGTANSPSRVVNLASLGNFLYAPSSGILFDDINGEKSYRPYERYGQSKLANILFSHELNRRESGKNVISVALHPGVIIGTGLMHGTYRSITSLLDSLYSVRKAYMWKLLGDNKTIAQGAATTVFCALCPTITPGEYYSDCKVENKYVHEATKDQALQKKFWEFTEQLIAAKL